MDDPDVIAYLFPPEGQGRDGAKEAINMLANRSRFLPPRRRNDSIMPAPESQSRFVREKTEELEGQPPEDSSRPGGETEPAGRLSFAQVDRRQWYHFALTFNEKMRLAVKDLDSTVGTRVIYDGEEGQRGHGIAWSARGPSLAKGKVPVIKVVGELQFRLIVPDHDITSQAYRDNVARFLEGAALAEDLFLDMKITNRTQTELPTPGGADTPSTQKPGRIFWKKELARGSFAVVKYVWDVTSGEEYALKESLPGARGDWDWEADIMMGISHYSIVALRYASFDNGPQLYFEYVPGGSLDSYQFTTPVQRAQIVTQLPDGLTYLHNENAAAEKAGPFNSNVLLRLLGILAGHSRTADTPSWSQREHVRPPTCSPPPEGNTHFETFCHNELVKAGGQPVMSFELLLHASKDANANRKILEPWLGDTDNRGKYAGDEGFAAFLESRRKRYLHKGELEVVSDHSFEETAKQIWEYEPRYLELSGKEGFTAYKRAVERRPVSHHFTQPFQLAEDPRLQDTWTTWVEYLGYIYWWLGRHAAAMRVAEPQYRQAWDELQRFNTSPLSTTPTTTRTLDEELGVTRGQLETTRQQIRKFIKGTNAYRRGEMAVHRQGLRAHWVLEQLPFIDTTRGRQETTMTSYPQQPKRRRQEDQGIGSAPDRETETEKGSGIVMPDATAATSTTASPGPRRSQRRRAGVAVEEAPSPIPPAEARGIRKTQRQRRT
ncbi:hypothetical protein GQ44DRAFT_779505 [Phaeosphaeriaceae sp. PMI808]|nr:hypothetical protein GQ44DRAFT_779505 [Phaeosphaeriaceae sp. PMI808]